MLCTSLDSRSLEMFCFPYPRDTDVESIRVPLIARTQYSITGQPKFLEYSTRELDAEIQKVKVAGSDAQESRFSPSHMLASAIQSSLFFGLASEALGRNIRHQEFADADPDGTHISIDLRIPQWYWQELKARWDELDDSLIAAEFEAKRAQLNNIYESAQITVICMDLLANDLDDVKLTKILLSIHMLLYLVAHVLGDSDTPKVTQTTTSLASTKLLKRRMTKNGWCEKRLNFLDVSPMAYPTFYFLSSLKPPRINAEDHSSCSSERCLITSKLSKPLHRTDECLCEDVVVPVDSMNAIVASGGVPLVRIARSPLGKTELEVVPYTPSFRFIAISHVWADQQFGSAQNCLPKCQVGYLEEVLSSLPTSTNDWELREWVVDWRSSRPGEIAPPSHAYEYFWLDSFCIPQAVEHADLRSKAIESMNFIYASASHTFVFDKGLQALDAGRRPASLARGGRPTYYSPRDENLLDVVANIYASNWMGRAWTLQEGILSGHLVFPLHGSLAYLKLLWLHYDDGFGGFWEVLATSLPKVFRRLARDSLRRGSKPKTEISKRLQDKSEPLREAVRHQLFTHISQSLHVEEYREYVRTPVSRLLDSQAKCV